MMFHEGDDSIRIPGCQPTAEVGDYVVDVGAHQHVGERDEQSVVQSDHLRREGSEGTTVIEPGLFTHVWLRVECGLLRGSFVEQCLDAFPLLVRQLAFLEPL